MLISKLVFILNLNTILIHYFIVGLWLFMIPGLVATRAILLSVKIKQVNQQVTLAL